MKCSLLADGRGVNDCTTLQQYLNGLKLAFVSCQMKCGSLIVGRGINGGTPLQQHLNGLRMATVSCARSAVHYTRQADIEKLWMVAGMD